MTDCFYPCSQNINRHSLQYITFLFSYPTRAARPVSWYFCWPQIGQKVVSFVEWWCLFICLLGINTVSKDHTTGSPSPVTDKIKVYYVKWFICPLFYYYTSVYNIKYCLLHSIEQYQNPCRWHLYMSKEVYWKIQDQWWKLECNPIICKKVMAKKPPKIICFQNLPIVLGFCP